MIDQDQVRKCYLSLRITEFENAKLDILREGKSASYTIRKLIRESAL
jgi:hypothetical protein